jgi:hypothetical protein
MNSNALVVAMSALSLGATCWLVASMPKGDDARVAELETKLAAAEKRADAVESLRVELRTTTERLERRITDVDRVETRTGRGPSAPAPEAAQPAETAAAADAKPLQELADRLEKKMESLAARDKERGEDGKWKAPLDELAAELKLSDAQKAETKRIFDHARDETFTLLKTQRLDGGSLLDDFAGALKSGADPAESTRQLFRRIFTEKVPGSDQTYLAEAIALTQDVEDELSGRLDAGQMKRLKALRVDLLDVKTGYDPVGDYVRAKVQ